jgi:hypothetical protein
LVAVAALVALVALPALPAVFAFKAFGTVTPVALIFDAVTAPSLIFCVPTEFLPSFPFVTALFLICFGEPGLSLKHAKTRIVHLREGGEGFDFLGFHHRYVRGRTPRSRHLTFLVRWPSRRAMQHARDRVREITARERLALSVEDVVQDLNRFLRGWAGYFRYGSSAQFFDKISLYAINRLAIFVANHHQRERRWGWWAVARQPHDHVGLIDLNGIIVPPRAFQPRHRAR